MRINPNLNIDQLKEDYEESKNVIIHNFLVEEDAELLWDWLANKMPEDWWFTAMKAGGEGYDAPLSIRRTDDNIKKRSGIFEFILGGSKDYKLLNVRLFETATKRSAYASQTKTAKTKNKSIAAIFGIIMIGFIVLIALLIF